MAHTFDTSLDIAESNGDPVTGNITLGASATVLVLFITTDTNTTRLGGAPTYDGNTMLIGADGGDTGGEGTAEIWYLLDPPTGSSLEISVPNTGTSQVSVRAASFISSTGASVLDDTQIGSAVGANPSTSVTTTEDGAVICDAMFSGHNQVPSANNRTLLFKADTGNESNGTQYHLQATQGLIAMSWTASSDDWNQAVASFVESSAVPDLNVDISDQLNMTEDVTLTGQLGDIVVSTVLTLTENVDFELNSFIDVSDQLNIVDNFDPETTLNIDLSADKIGVLILS